MKSLVAWEAVLVQLDVNSFWPEVVVAQGSEAEIHHSCIYYEAETIRRCLQFGMAISGVVHSQDREAFARETNHLSGFDQATPLHVVQM